MSSSQRRSEAQARPSLLAAVTAECVGTYVLVFFGTGAVAALTLNGIPGAAPDLLRIAFAFGLAVLVVIYGLGHVSGAHLNPAVTVALAVVRKFPFVAVPAYIGAQLAGAVLASLTVWALFGKPRARHRCSWAPRRRATGSRPARPCSRRS